MSDDCSYKPNTSSNSYHDHQEYQKNQRLSNTYIPPATYNNAYTDHSPSSEGLLDSVFAANQRFDRWYGSSSTPQYDETTTESRLSSSSDRTSVELSDVSTVATGYMPTPNSSYEPVQTDPVDTSISDTAENHPTTLTLPYSDVSEVISYMPEYSTRKTGRAKRQVSGKTKRRLEKFACRRSIFG